MGINITISANDVLILRKADGSLDHVPLVKVWTGETTFVYSLVSMMQVDVKPGKSEYLHVPLSGRGLPWVDGAESLEIVPARRFRGAMRKWEKAGKKKDKK